MAERSFEQSIAIAAAPEVVHAFLADLHRHRDLHPLIERIEDLPPHPARPDVRRYRVTDRMRLGPLSFRIAYVAEIKAIPPDLVLGTAWQSPGVALRTRYRVTRSHDGGTDLREEVVLNAPFPLIGYAHRQAEAAHRETFAKLKVLLERGSARGAALEREQRDSGA
ncbi:MAG: SRPBCC family protein [bacterium]